MKDIEEKNNNSIKSIKKIYSDMIRLAEECGNVVSLEYEQLIQSENYYKNQARFLEIEFSEYSENSQFKKSIENFKQQIQGFKIEIEQVKDSFANDENIDYSKIELDVIQNFQENTLNLKTEIFVLKDILEKYKLQSENEIKNNLVKKVFSIIKNEDIRRLEEEKQELCNTKVGLLGNFLGKENLRQEKIENLELLIQAQILQTADNLKKCSIQDILVKLYICAIQNRQGNFSAEMSDIYNKIKSAYNLNGNLDYSDENIYDLAINYFEVEKKLLPVNIKSKKSIKEEIVNLIEENEQIQSQIFSNKIKNTNENLNNSSINYFGKFISSIQKISSMFLFKDLDTKNLEYNEK